MELKMWRVTLINPKFHTSLLSIQSSDAKNVSLPTPHRGSSWSYTPPFSLGPKVSLHPFPAVVVADCTPHFHL